MRWLTSAVAAAAVGLLAACGGTGVGAPGGVPVASQTKDRGPIAQAGNKPNDKGGIYVVVDKGGNKGAVFGYRNQTTSNDPKPCSVKPFGVLSDIAVDGAGDLVVPDPTTEEVHVFRGPRMCG